jgi:hypothetical protein
MDDEPPVAGSCGPVFRAFTAARWRTFRLDAVIALLVSVGASGCRSTGPVQTDYVQNIWFGHVSIAVAPAVNLSGSRDFDPNRLADLMAVELGYVQGVRVIPVSRVLGVLAAQGTAEIRSAAQAVEVAQWVGADAILVFAVTEYDPYDPPRVGISAQLYGAKSQTDEAVAGAEPASQPAAKSGNEPILAETQRVFDASHAGVVSEIQEFAKHRIADDSPYGWRKYVVTQEGFVEFCCHRTVAALARRPGVVEVAAVQGR